MAQKMTFNYFYGNEADQYSFYRVPKLLFTNDYFRDLSSDAKLLYGLMLDRMSLSVKNHWFDDKNRAYIYFSIEDIMELLNCGKNKAVKSLRELDDESGIGLIEKRRQGFGKANIIYVKSFLINEESDYKQGTLINSSSIDAVSSQEGISMKDECCYYESRQMTEIATESEHVPEKQRFTDQTSDEAVSTQEVYNLNFKNPSKQTSRIPQNKLQEVYKTNPINTYYSDTDNSYNQSYRILSEKQKYIHSPENDKRYDSDTSFGAQEAQLDPISMSDGGFDTLRTYHDLVRKNIEYDILMEARPDDRDLIRQICDLIVEVILSRSEEIIVASCRYPAELVRSRFLKLNYDHILYVLDCLDKTTTKVKNIRKYLMAALFNAPVTIDGYYRSEVKYDIYRASIYV